MSTVLGHTALPVIPEVVQERLFGRVPHDVKRFVVHLPHIATCAACGAHYRVDITDAAAQAHAKELGHRRWTVTTCQPWDVPPDTRLQLVGSR